MDPAKITAVGSSFGGYLVSLLSAERSVKALVLRVPANYEDRGFTAPLHAHRMEKSRQEWKLRMHSHDATKSLRALHIFKGRVLVVESEKDEIVPASVVQSYGNAITKKKQRTYKIMKNAPHSISRYPNFQRTYRKIVLDWLK